jgi:hypothetical protein
MKIKIWHLTIVLSLFSLSCMVTTAGLNLLEPGSIFFQDDFSNTGSGWDRVDTDAYVMDYGDGVYRIRVNEPDIDVWATPGLSFEDVILEVDATKAGGPDDNSFGLICRENEERAEYYFFVISSDGYYGIGKVIGGEQILLNSNVMQPSEVIYQGYALNSLRAECVGQRLTLFVNGTKLAEVSDNDLSNGEIGVVAGSFKEAGIDIYFDNFLVIKP